VIFFKKKSFFLGRMIF